MSGSTSEFHRPAHRPKPPSKKRESGNGRKASGSTSISTARCRDETGRAGGRKPQLLPLPFGGEGSKNRSGLCSDARQSLHHRKLLELPADLLLLDLFLLDTVLPSAADRCQERLHRVGRSLRQQLH